MKTAMRLLDENDRVIQKGSNCVAYNEEKGIYFDGTVIGYKDDFVLVEDMEKNVFSIEEYNIKIEFDLWKLEEEEGLKRIEITQGKNGYPSGLQDALIGFDNIEHAQLIAEKYGLSVRKFHQKEGWLLWEDMGQCFNDIEVTSEMYGDNYNLFHKMEEEDFFSLEIDELINQFDNFADLEQFIENKKEIWEEIEVMEDDEVVITSYGSYSETVKDNRMIWSHDTHTYVIGVK